MPTFYGRYYCVAIPAYFLVVMALAYLVSDDDFPMLC
jgi:hypothetical protein